MVAPKPLTVKRSFLVAATPAETLSSVPTNKNSWGRFFAIDSKEILLKPELFIYFDLEKQQFFNSQGNPYTHYTLDEAINSLPNMNGNIDERISYDWNSTRDCFANKTTVITKSTKDSEFSVFLENFLQWEKQFSILGKKVVDVKETSSCSVDITLIFYGGTTQKLELEHEWNNYILHQHYKNIAWKNCWLYANESWDFNKIKKIFSPYIGKYYECIPKIFLCTDPDTKCKKAYQVDWDELSYCEIIVE